MKLDKYEDDATWKVPDKQKNNILGPNGKVLSGGAMPDCPDKPELGDKSPLTYHGSPVSLYQELIHGFQASSVFCALDVEGARHLESGHPHEDALRGLGPHGPSHEDAARHAGAVGLEAVHSGWFGPSPGLFDSWLNMRCASCFCLQGATARSTCS